MSFPEVSVKKLTNSLLFLDFPPIYHFTYDDHIATTLGGPQTRYQPVSAILDTDISGFFSSPHGPQYQDARSTGGENIMGGDVGGDVGGGVGGDVGGDVGAPL